MAQQITYLTWLNPLGGFDYWPFLSKTDEEVEVEDTQTTNKNIFPDWPRSYSADADTIKKQTFKRTRKQIVLKSQPLSRLQANQLLPLRTSTLVQMLTNRHDRITMIPDTSSFTITRGMDKLHYITITLSYTNNLPTQHA